MPHTVKLLRIFTKSVVVVYGKSKKALSIYRLFFSLNRIRKDAEAILGPYGKQEEFFAYYQDLTFGEKAKDG